MKARLEFEIEFSMNGRLICVAGTAEGWARVEKAGYYSGVWYLDGLKVEVESAALIDEDTGEALQEPYELNLPERAELERRLKESDKWTLYG